MEKTREHLDLLGVFHYAVAGLTLLCGGAYGLMMFGMAAAFSSVSDRGKTPPPPEIAWLMGGMGVLVIALMAASAFTVALAGWCLRARKGWIYCVVIAAISLTSVPIGTALGVFTLIVLMRPEAKALFGATRSSP